MSIQQEVLDCIGPDGIGAKDLRGRLGNLPQNELDVCTHALMRMGKIALTFGRFELAGTKGVRCQPPVPTAAEEAVASLQPATLVCKTCAAPQPECEFRVIGTGHKRSEECNTCHGKKVTAGLPKVRGQVARAEPEKPQPVVANHVFERLRNDQQNDLSRIAVLEVDLANLRTRTVRRQRFFDEYEALAEGVA